MSNPLLNLIVQGESGAVGYNAYNRGTYVDPQGGKHIRGPNGSIDFSSLTVGQVNDRQHLRGDDPNRVFAVGKYQVIPTTMDDAILKLHLDRNQMFTPELQDRIFSQYLIVDKRPDIHGFITGQPGVTLAAAQRSLAQEWASFGDPDKHGASYYGGANHASITLAQSERALNQMRASYKADIVRGLSPAEAWKDVTTSDHNLAQAQRHGAQAAGHSSDPHLLQQHDRGDAVHALQAHLAQLGYTDTNGHRLKPDGDFGPNTCFAVEAFQRDHHLAIDGKVGPHTQAALDQALKAQTSLAPHVALLSDSLHPDHALFRQALAGVHRIDSQIGRRPDVRSDNLAGALAVAAKAKGMSRIDEVAMQADGARAFAAQKHVGYSSYAEVATLTAIDIPLEKSSAAARTLPEPAAAMNPYAETPEQQRNGHGTAPGLY